MRRVFGEKSSMTRNKVGKICVTRPILRTRSMSRYTWPGGKSEREPIVPRVHADQVVQGKLDLVHVQADEIRGKGWKMVPWIGLAMMVSTQMTVGGRGEPAPGSSLSGCAAPDGQCLLPALESSPGADRRLGRLSRLYSAGLSRKGQESSGPRTLPTASLARGLDWDG